MRGVHFFGEKNGRVFEIPYLIHINVHLVLVKEFS